MYWIIWNELFYWNHSAFKAASGFVYFQRNHCPSKTELAMFSKCKCAWLVGQKQWRNALWNFPNQEPYFWTNIINSIKSLFFLKAWHNRMFLAWHTVYWKPPTENYYFPAGYFAIFTVCREMHWCILVNVQLVNKQETLFIRGHSRLHICTKTKSANWCPPEFSD